MDLSQYTNPRFDSKNYMTQESKDAWNNYQRAQSVRESLTPGSMNYGQIQRLPNEGWNEWQDRKSAASDMFGGGLSGSYGLSNALRAEQGLSSGGSVKSSRSGGGGGGGGGGGMVMGQPQPLDFYMGLPPMAEELNLNYEEMGKRAMEANKPYAEQYKQLVPGTEAGLLKMSELANTQLSGQLDPSMIGNIGRQAAQLGYSTGLGGRSGLGRNDLVRSLGLNTLQVQQQGADLLSKSSQLAQQVMQAKSPISQGQVFNEAVSQASYNSQIRNDNALNKYQSQARPGQFDITTGSFVGYQPGSRVTTRPIAPTYSARV